MKSDQLEHEQVAGRTAEIKMKQVTLFFLSESDGLLHAEERQIPESDLMVRPGR
jgi:hypothetical protein